MSSNATDRSATVRTVLNSTGRKLALLTANQLATLSLVLVALIGASALISPHFLTPFNITTLLRQLAFVGIVSIGQGFLLLLGDIDASVGAIAGLGAVIAAMFTVNFGMHPVLGIVIGFAAGAILGGFNGFLITAFGLSPLVLTIGMLTTYSGLNLAISRGKTITGYPEYITQLGQGTFLGIPIPTIFWLAVFGTIWFITKRTVFGRNMYAIGNSPEAARMVGINSRRVRIVAYAITGSLASLAGILMSLRIASAQPSIGNIWLLPSIAAPVIGGIAITGGVGTITGALVGGAIMAVVTNIVVLGGVNLYWQQVINGGIVVLAIIVDSLGRARRA